MKSIRSWWLSLMALLAASAEEPAPLRLVQTIPLPNVEGRLDHLAMDSGRQRLFVAALGNNTLEIVDLKKGAVSKTIAGFREPQGIAYAPEPDKLFVASGEDGLCKVFDGASLDLVATLRLGADADNVRYDAAARRVYVGDEGLATVDAIKPGLLGRVKLAAHPESFQLEGNGPRLFVNLPNARQVAVVDRQKRAVVAEWPMTIASENYPMALDEPNRRLFIGCRKSPTLAVLDTASGTTVTSLPIDGDTDDLFYDAKRRQVYVSCGGGFLDVIRQSSPDRYESLARIASAPGARTSLFVPALDRLYLAVPHRGAQPAAIWIYELRP